MINRRLTFFSLFFLLLAISAQARVFSPETMMLKNGMQIVVIPNHRAPVVTHMVWYKTGAMNDPWGKSGIAHFLEHLMFKGTPAHPEGAYSRIISQLGGQENAMTSYDYTAYYASVGKEHLAEIMALESDRMAHWRVNDKQMAAEREVILKERQQRTENDPVSAFFEEVNALSFINHPYQRPTIGWRDEMVTLNREDAESFHAKYYAPNNAILVLSGDVTLGEIKPLVERYYAPLPRGPIVERISPLVAELRAQRRITQESPLVKERSWSRHIIIDPARPTTISKSDALTVYAKILGDGRTGRLYRRLVMRDKLATQASIAFDPVSFGPARFIIAVTPLPGADMNRIERIVDEEVSKIAMQGISDAELKKATQALEIAATYARDSLMGPAMTIGEALVSGLDLATVEAWPERMRKVTVASVREQAIALAKKNTYAVTAILLPETGLKAKP